MAHKVLKNVDYIASCYIATPEGVSVSIHPGEYVIGDFFVRHQKKTFLEIVEIEIEAIPFRLIKYKQKD